MTQLSPHFSLEELTETSVRLPNEPNITQTLNLKQTAEGMEQVRALLGHPIKVNSAFRSRDVNAAVGGSKTSDHVNGWCVDFKCPAFGSPYQIAKAIEASKIRYDQLILEYGWVHISFNPRQRMEKLTKRSAAAPYEVGINA